MTTTPLREITFSPEHAIESVLYILSRLGGKADVHSVLKAVYYADLHHIAEFGGRTSSGDDIRALEFGPAPDGVYKLLQAAARKQSEYIPPSFYDRVAGVIDGSGYPELRALRAPDAGYLSRSDLASLDAAIPKVAGKSFDRRTQESHDEAWRAARERWATTGDMRIRLEEMIGTLPDADAILEHVYADH
jgi:hypothetical protein